MKGIGVSSGIGIGKIFLYKEPVIKINKVNIDDVSFEIERFESALGESINQLDKLYELIKENIGEEKAKIFIAHKMMLEDPEFITDVKDKIECEKVNSEYAVNEVVNFYVSIFENNENEYIKSRVVDLRDVSKRLLRILLGIKSIDLASIDEISIIVAKDLAPSEAAQMNKEMVTGIVTELGGITSHTSIIARTLGIPAIVGAKDFTKIVNHGDYIIINGDNGEVILKPTTDEIVKYGDIIKELKKYKKELLSLKDEKSISKDGFKVEIAGNIGTSKDIDKVIENGGEGVGLYRTEFLFMDRDKLPSEEEQFEAYKIVANKLNNKPLIIRTLDIGGDKDLPYLDLEKEMNPFLGCRAIRLCLDRKDIFITQLRAILRASVFGNIKIMFPMISSIDELREAKKVLKNAKEELYKEDIPFDREIEVGIMVEVPAVALMSDIFAKEVDFFSIGTNDLIQYTTAVDRGNSKIAYLYNQYHPAILRLIKIVIDNAHREGIKVGMCGESAGDKKLLPILLAMGLDGFSMNPLSILRSRYDLKKYSKEEVEKHIDELLNLSTSEEVQRYIDIRILK